METSPVIHLMTDAKGNVLHEVHVQMQELPVVDGKPLEQDVSVSLEHSSGVYAQKGLECVEVCIPCLQSTDSARLPPQSQTTPSLISEPSVGALDALEGTTVVAAFPEERATSAVCCAGH